MAYTRRAGTWSKSRTEDGLMSEPGDAISPALNQLLKLDHYTD
jgi:hypothetical protein